MAIHGGGHRVVGDGEFTMARIANRIEGRKNWEDLPNLVIHRNGVFRRNPGPPFPSTGSPR